MNSEFKSTVENIREKLIQKVAAHLTTQKREFLLSTRVVFNGKLRTSIGRAHLQNNVIELNPHLLARFPNELQKTFAHEFAHIVAPIVFGRSGLGHQVGWRKIMHAFGFPAERTHNLPVQARARRPHRIVAIGECTCAGRTHEIKPRTYRKIKFGRREYVCVICRRKIVFRS